MPRPYTVARVRLYIEPPAGLPPVHLQRLQPPASFISAARQELRLTAQDGPQGPRGGPPVFDDFWNPPAQLIDPLTSPHGRHDFFQAQAESLWDACCSRFDTLPDRGAPRQSFTATLLVEYELPPDFPLSEDDTRFLFLDCKRRFIPALKTLRLDHPRLSEDDAANLSWARVAHDMRLAYGLSEARLWGIVKSGTPRWNNIKRLPGARLSFAHTPAVHWVLTPPPRPAYTPRLRPA